MTVLDGTRVEALDGDELALAALAAAGEPGGGWRRVYGRAEPDEEPFALLAYQRVDDRRRVVRVEAWSFEPPPVSGRAATVREPGIGWLRVGRLPWDPRLPALPRLLAEAPEAEIVRYCPYNRCTLRVAGRRWAKVFSDARGARIHAESLGVWQAARSGAIGFAVARPDRLDAATGVLWQGELAGVPPKAALAGPGGAGLAGRMGAAAASLASAPIVPHRALGGELAVARSARRCRRLARLLPDLAPRLEEIHARLRALHGEVPARPQRPVHGDLKAGQMLLDGDTLGLVDWEELGLGDPERDVATFLADLALRSTPGLPAGELAAAFLAGYEAVEPVDRRLVRAYLVHKALRKALVAATELRPEGRDVARARVERAARWAEEEEEL